MAELSIKGKVIKVLPELSGTSQAGKTWVKQDFVIEEIEGSYPKKICFTGFGDKVVPVVKTLTVGQEVEVYFNAESREYNDKYFTQLNAWKISKNPNGITNAPTATTQTASEPVGNPPLDDTGTPMEWDAETKTWVKTLPF